MFKVRSARERERERDRERERERERKREVCVRDGTARPRAWALF